MKTGYSRLTGFFSGIADNCIGAHAAASAFYTFLSLVPFVSIISSVIPFTGLEKDALLHYVSRYIPQALETVIRTIIDDIYLASGIALPVSIVIAIWLASRAFFSLIRGMEVIVGNRTQVGFFRRSFIACLYTIGLMAAMVCVLLLLVFGRRLIYFILDNFPTAAHFIVVLFKFRFLIAVIVLTLIFLMVYHWIPGMKMGFGSLLPGALVASCAWLLFTWIFSLFIKYLGGYSAYGSLAAIIICLMWMYWCMYIILLGAYLNMFIKNARTAQINE